MQRLNVLISAAIDEHERRYGLVSNRAEFENLEVELPLRLRGIFNERSARMLPRNTFIDMQQLTRSRSSLLMLGGGGGGMLNFRGSAPDLSRSVPSTPIMHKQQRAQMRSELVLAEDDEDEQQQQVKRASVATLPGSRSQLRLMTQETVQQPQPNELVKVVTTTPLLNSAEELNGKPPAMSTFRQATTPPAMPPKTPDDMGLVTNRFGRMDVNEPAVELRIHEGPVLTAHTQRLLHSTSFAIKRPSLASRSSGRSSLSSAQSMYNMHELSTSTRYCSDAEIIFDAGRKAAALLDEVQPQLRSTLKTNGTNGHAAAADDFYCDLYAAKYRLPRIAAQRQHSLDNSQDTAMG